MTRRFTGSRGSRPTSTAEAPKYQTQAAGGYSRRLIMPSRSAAPLVFLHGTSREAPTALRPPDREMQEEWETLLYGPRPTLPPTPETPREAGPRT